MRLHLAILTTPALSQHSVYGDCRVDVTVGEQNWHPYEKPVLQLFSWKCLYWPQLPTEITCGQVSQLGGKIRCQFSKDPLSKRVLITTPKESWSTAHIFFVPPTVACVHQQLRNWRHGWGLQVAGNPQVAVLSLAKWGWKSVCPHDEPRHARPSTPGM